MSSRELVSTFWAAMQANDWHKAGGYLAPQSARVIAFSELEGGYIARQIEYWPVSYDPPPGRGDLTRPIDRVP